MSIYSIWEEFRFEVGIADFKMRLNNLFDKMLSDASLKENDTIEYLWKRHYGQKKNIGLIWVVNDLVLTPKKIIWI